MIKVVKYFDSRAHYNTLHTVGFVVSIQLYPLRSVQCFGNYSFSTFGNTNLRLNYYWLFEFEDKAQNLVVSRSLITM